MSALPYQDQEEQWDSDVQEPQMLDLPPRPRRQWFNRGSATLLALIVGAAGFYAGIQIEKSQLTTSSASAGSLPAFAAGSLGRRAPAGAGRQGGLPTGFGPASAGGNGSVGTVSNISGRTIYVKDSTGNTIEVKLSTATKITKSVKVSRRAVRPGDSVVVQGIKNSDGTLTAASLSDSGASSTGSTSSGANSSTSSGSASSNSGASGVTSLFSPGGG